MTKHLLFAIIVLFPFSTCLLSQQPYDIEAIEDVIEEIAENNEIELDYASLVEDLIYFAENPINLNSCTYDDLAKLQFLTDFQIKSLLEYVKKMGPIVSITEIQYIYGFDNQLVSYMKRFVVLESEPEKQDLRLKEALTHGRNELILLTTKTLQQKAGNETIPDSILELQPNKSRYFGNPYKIRARYTYHYFDKLKFGFQAEKDAGEEFFGGNNNKGFDFYSGYLQVNNVGQLRNITIGDYQLQFGQGLTLYSGLAFGKSAFSSDVVKRTSGIKKYSSADENQFFRGIAGTYQIGRFNISGFYSNKNIDANITDTLENRDYEFSSFQTSGYHRTPLEIEDNNSIREISTGGNIQYIGESLRIGYTLISYTFNGNYSPAEKPYNLYSFRGSSLFNTGIDFRYRWHTIELFGETSYSNQHWATLNGMVVQAGELASFSLLYRNYSKGFFAYRNNPFSEYTSKNNEKGVYLGTTLYPIKFVKLIAYFDVFKSPWLRYNASSPTAGRDYLVQLFYTPNRNFELNLRFKSETKAKDENDETLPVPVTKDYTICKTRLGVNYKIWRNVNFRNRIEASQFSNEENSREMGYYLSHDIVFSAVKFPLSFWLRCAFFSCDSYDSRIYAYENSMPYSFSVPSFYNKGIRGYCMLKYSSKYFKLWLRYSITKYNNIETIGSGLDEIDGNVKSDIEIMLGVKF